MRDTIGYRRSASTVNTSGLLTMPWMSSLCCDGSMTGTPPWFTLKWSPFGVMIPLSN